MKPTRWFAGVWVVGTLLLSGGLAALCWTQHKALLAARERLRVQAAALQELEQLRDAARAAQTLTNQQAELERLRESARELLRLRNEVAHLRQLTQELAVLRAANATLLQAVQGVPGLSTGQVAMVMAARKSGSILGITVRPPASGRAGAEVTGIDPNSPIATSGIAVGDIIYAMDGQRVNSPGDLQALMLTRAPGQTVTLDLLRGESPFRITTQTRAWPQ
ncbi:MAG: PDZ domain-containing protein [Verrucomicrobiae bacterium]|nr:PDZ domain-containing protein [Verrucomicrobiae bacterium]MDW8309024.1 PDZ domain-containing protein [Verrucomicrobiales bacterium]